MYKKSCRSQSKRVSMGGNGPQQLRETKDPLSVYLFQVSHLGGSVQLRGSTVCSEAFREAFCTQGSIFCITESVPSQPLALQRD